MYYILLFILVIIVDRVSKWWVLTHEFVNDQQSILSIDVVINRGFSWSILDSENPLLFVVVNSIIIAITGALAIWTYKQYKSKKPIWGEVLVLAGSLSNIIDRACWSGVVDFIHLSYRGYSFPIFNLADVAIVCGVFLMLVQFWLYEE